MSTEKTEYISDPLEEERLRKLFVERIPKRKLPEKLRELMQVLSLRQISDLCGVGKESIKHIIYSPTKNVKKAHYLLIMDLYKAMAKLLDTMDKKKRLINKILNK
jgi:hypothetical protein